MGLVGSRRAAVLGGTETAAHRAIRYGLVSAWNLADLTDSYGTNTLTNNASATFTAGKRGNALTLVAASSQFLSIADNASVSTGDIDFAFSFWFNPTTIDVGGDDILGKWSALNEQEILVELDTTGGASFRFAVSSTGAAVTGDLKNAETILVAGTWIHAFLWHDSVANTLNYRLNNAAAKSLSYSSGVRDGASPFEIGRAVAAGRFFNGQIDAVAFFKSPPGGITAVADEMATFFWRGGAGREWPW